MCQIILTKIQGFVYLQEHPGCFLDLLLKLVHDRSSRFGKLTSRRLLSPCFGRVGVVLRCVTLVVVTRASH